MTTADYTLAHGTHAAPEEGRCAMEWVSHLAGEPHTDAPTCVSPVLRAVCVTLNDGLADGPRQRLRPYLARTIGTADDGLDPARAWAAMDWLLRTYTPVWLRLAGLPGEAAALAAGPPIRCGETLAAGVADLAHGRRAARRMRASAFRAGRDPLSARVAAIAGGRAGREAAWTCAGAAAWAGARVALGDDAGDRARALIRTIAGDSAAVAVARVGGDDVCGMPSGARAVRRAALGPTLEVLADSALGLLEAMLVTEAITLPEPAAADGARTRRSPFSALAVH
jgi:hypothetical protein